MNLAEQIWSVDWPTKTKERITQAGASYISDFLAQHPCEPYEKLVKALGADIAAVQLQRLQFEEAERMGETRAAVKDALVRLIHHHLRRGWGTSVHLDFRTAGVYADLAAMLQFRLSGAKLIPMWDSVWQALREISPPEGWLPRGPDDPLISAAFQKGWPA